jgi:ribosome-binding factor A
VSHRIRRVNVAVKEVLADAVRALKDPRVGFVTITDVRTSADLRHAEVFYTVLPDDEPSRARTQAGLDSATSTLQRTVGSELRLRHVPVLHFVEDPVPAQGRRIEQLLADEEGARTDADR